MLICRNDTTGAFGQESGVVLRECSNDISAKRFSGPADNSTPRNRSPAKDISQRLSYLPGPEEH